MKTLLNTLGFLAVVNLLALGIFVGWLWKSGRLDGDRIQEVRRILATPIAEANAAAEERAAKADAAAQRDVELARVANPPLDVAAQNRRNSPQMRRREDALRRRMNDERRMLLAGLDTHVKALEERQAEFRDAEQGRRDAAAASRREIAETQFAKAVKQLESIPAKQAKSILLTLIADEGTDRAVAYLDAMNPRAAAKVLREFKTESEIRLATELLEALRTYGLVEAGRKESGNAATSPATAAE